MRGIENVVKVLREKSVVDKHKGMGGEEVVVDKELLKEAAIYLEDYMERMGY